ncbi:P-loop containing nucleoside triphosphate hydrolase protein [Russula vinacea]|nr:P-loop containing nucleoside triphosphate hydrolase protein [Russula vinacea]
MSRLNASAFEFVPGKRFGPGSAAAQQQPQAPPQPAFVRPEEPEAPPAPPPTINLNIGGAKPVPAAPPPSEMRHPPGFRAISKTFTMGRAKTDTAAIAQEVATVADQEVLEDLFGDIKEHLNVVFIGHVDAGKSTMGGNILFLCGMVDKRTMENWYLSWALDSTPLERSKGKTVEIGRAYFETTARRYTILDAPGHKTYVPSMISGAAQADIALLVISARKGEGGQTREHIMLVKTAGVNKVVVVINKMDDQTVNWEKARYEEIKEKLTPFVRGAGFHLKTDVSWIPVSAQTGANLRTAGPSLLELLDKLPMVDRKIKSPVMIPISEKYKDMGTIAVGKLEHPLLMPNKDEIEVAAMYNEIEEEVQIAVSGDNVRIRLRGVEDDDISPGFVLTSLNKPVHAVRQFEAQLAILDHKNIICAGYSAVMHVHTLAEEVTLSALLHYFDKTTGRKSRKPPQFAKKSQRIVALLETNAPICLERFSDYPQLGRFTLRDEGTGRRLAGFFLVVNSLAGKTVAIGKVTKLIEAHMDELAEARPTSMSTMVTAMAPQQPRYEISKQLYGDNWRETKKGPSSCVHAEMKYVVCALSEEL